MGESKPFREKDLLCAQLEHQSIRCCRWKHMCTRGRIPWQFPWYEDFLICLLICSVLAFQEVCLRRQILILTHLLSICSEAAGIHAANQMNNGRGLLDFFWEQGCRGPHVLWCIRSMSSDIHQHIIIRAHQWALIESILCYVFHVCLNLYVQSAQSNVE